MNFIEMCIAGLALPEQVDDRVDDWHNDTEPGDGIALRDYLGMSKEEYAAWVFGKLTVAEIIFKRK